MAANLINYGGMFVLAVMITRMLGIDALGEFTLIFSFVMILTAITDLGISQMLVRRLNSERGKAWSIIRSVNRFRLKFSFVCVAVVISVMYFIPGAHLTAAFAAGIAIVIPKTLQSAYDSSIRALQQQWLPAIIKSAVTLLQMVFVYIILLGSPGMLYVMLVLLTTEMLAMGAFYLTAEDLWKSETDIKDPALIPVKPFIKEALPFFGNTLFALSLPRIVMILLGYITSAASLGIYSAASRFTGGIGLVSGALYNTYYPVMTGSKITPAEGFRLTARLAVYALGLGIVIASALFLLSDILIGLSFKIPEAASVLKILSVTVIPVLVYSVLQPYLISLHRENFIFKSYIALFALILPAAIMLIHFYGYFGAAYVSASAEILFCGILIYEFIKHRTNPIVLLNETQKMDLKYLRHLAQKNSTFIHPKGFEATSLLIAKLNIQPNDNILEIGCGTGGTLIEIGKKYEVNISAVEILGEMITSAEKKINLLNLSEKIKIFKIIPGNRYPFENNSFDKIYAESVIGFQDRNGMGTILSEVKRLLKKDGIFILNDALWKPGISDNLVNEITKQAFKDFGLAHASPSNIDFDKLKCIAENQGLKVIEKIDIAQYFNVSKIKSNQTETTKLNLFNWILGMKYRWKLRKHQKYSKLIIPYIVSFENEHIKTLKTDFIQ